MADITSALQLNLWVDGHPFHKGEPSDPHSQCCPDFSCCEPSLLQPKEVREAFKAAVEAKDEGQQMRMLGQFLGTGICELTDKKVHIAGLPGPIRELVECGGCPGCHTGDCAEGYYPYGSRR